ncbi:phosphotransferase family protein [Streptosporangium lutulentum]|uniref:Aminoglycoside phosphotransferase domain-containing protein n=1 Tax=Streptosporangium lutulentum TaxID=1461250 RepID=A0ABT9QU22_9ACTN|nr:phosphotransferase [Streptosporangium lutulentum]MDP9850252.1 hypothetical protein [Streptosporangium lutulentum]
MRHLLGHDVVEARSQDGGYTPGLAARLLLEDGSRAFLKGIALEHPVAGTYRQEAELSAALPEAAPVAALRWTRQVGGWVLLCFDDVADRHPALRPGSPDVAATVHAVSRLRETLTPCPLPAAPAVAEVLGPALRGWSRLTEDTPADLPAWARRNLMALTATESAWEAAAGGSTLVHGDIRPDNLLVREAGGEVVVVDWSYAHQGAAWIDVAALVPHLIMAGHAPAEAEAQLADAVAWGAAPAQVLTSWAVGCAGYWEHACRQPAPPGVPNLRGFQARAAAAALDWARYRTGWS